jgi:hypothetical protein
MSDFLRIEWPNDDTPHVDFLDSSVFANEVSRTEMTSRVQTLRGSKLYVAKYLLTVTGNTALFEYEKGACWEAGTTKLIFNDNSRESIPKVLWSCAEEKEPFKDWNAIAKWISALDQGANDEKERIERFAKIVQRPEQQKFSAELRQLYENRCAVTGCCTSEALEAAHIRIIQGKKRKDDNDLKNGILFRADIHALFDAGLITLTEDGCRIQLSNKFSGDPSYACLRTKEVFRPSENAPSRENIKHHRNRFGFS